MNNKIINNETSHPHGEPLSQGISRIRANNGEEAAGNREQFHSLIKKWVVADSQLKLLSEKTKQIRDIKQQLTDNICTYVHTNNINKKIVISDGELRIFEKKEYSTLTFSYLEECLENIIQNREHIDYIIQYIRDNREIETNFDIRRTIRK